jgi:hypothetical protein
MCDLIWILSLAFIYVKKKLFFQTTLHVDEQRGRVLLLGRDLAAGADFINIHYGQKVLINF